MKNSEAGLLGLSLGVFVGVILLASIQGALQSDIQRINSLEYQIDEYSIKIKDLQRGIHRLKTKTDEQT